MVKYIHDETHHNLVDPTIIVPHIIKAVNPKSVVDLGCGIGTFLNIFQKNGIDDVVGIDGEWTDKQVLSKYIDLSNFKIANLEERIEINKKFDVAICLEVAEHLSKDSAEIIVRNLTRLSDVIIFSAAFPGQGGQNHLNEQWPSYWQRLFNEHSYKFYDVLRPIFWKNNDLSDWYKQNIFLIIKTEKEGDILPYFYELNTNQLIDYVHPNYFEAHRRRGEQLEELERKYSDLLKGRNSIKMYFKVVAKYILRKVGLYKK